MLELYVCKLFGAPDDIGLTLSQLAGSLAVEQEVVLSGHKLIIK